MSSQSPFRAVDMIAGRRVGWMRDIPEDVETFMAEMIGRYHELLPAELPLVVAWSRWDFYLPFFGNRIEEDEGTYYAIFLGPEWSENEGEDREFEFVSSMYWCRRLEDGSLTYEDGHLRLDLDGYVSLDEDAWDIIANESEYLMRVAA